MIAEAKKMIAEHGKENAILFYKEKIEKLGSPRDGAERHILNQWKKVITYINQTK